MAPWSHLVCLLRLLSADFYLFIKYLQLAREQHIAVGAEEPDLSSGLFKGTDESSGLLFKYITSEDETI